MTQNSTMSMTIDAKMIILRFESAHFLILDVYLLLSADSIQQIRNESQNR